MSCVLSQERRKDMANNEEFATIDGTTWSYKVGDGGATITKCLRYKRRTIYDIPEIGTDNITVPSSLGGYPVRFIGTEAFCGCRELKSVKIPHGVESIGTSAFESCAGLESVNIPSSVTSIGPNAFNYCSRLKSVNIPSSVTSIKDEAFANCECLTDVTLGKHVTSIGRRAFSDCVRLTKIKIPNSVTIIGSCAFSNCPRLKKISIPDSVMNLAESAFSGCDKVHFDTKSIPGVELLDGWVIGHTSQLPSELNLAGVRGIGDGAFSGCVGLTSVTIGKGVTSIGNYAFSRCSGLTSVTIPDSVTSIGSSAFSHCSGLTSIVIPDGVTSIGAFAFGDCSGLTNVTMPAGMTSIDSGAGCLFVNCESLASITISSGVTSIEPLAFAPRPRQVSFVVDSVNPKYKSVNGLVLTKDGKTLVLGINGDVTIPDGVEIIGKDAFLRCEGLVAVRIPDSTRNIDDTAFSNCDNLTSIVVSEGNAVYSSANGLLLSKDGKTLVKGVNGDVTIPRGVTTIEGTAFRGCKGLRCVTMPDSVTKIEDGAFFGCSQLTRVEIPAGTANMSIGVNSFDGCDSLATIPRVGGAFPGDPDDPVRKEWERRVGAISGECRSLLIGTSSQSYNGRDGVKTMIKRAFSILPDEWNISNERDAGRYFRLFCNRIGLNAPINNDPLKDAQVEFGDGDAYLFEFTCGKSSYHALAARESHGVGKYADWERAHLFGVNYNPGTRSIDAPYSTSYVQRHIPNSCRGPMDDDHALCRVGLDEYGKDDDIGPMKVAIRRFESLKGRSLERGNAEKERKKQEEDREAGKGEPRKSPVPGKTGGMMSIDESLEWLSAICEINENRLYGTRPKGRGREELSDGKKIFGILVGVLGVLSWIYWLVKSINSVFDVVVLTIILLMIAFLVYVLRR